MEKRSWLQKTIMILKRKEFKKKSLSFREQSLFRKRNWLSERFKSEFIHFICFLKIINAQNETVKTINHIADKGFNIINYDLTVNATEKSKKADDGNVYIAPGKYTVEISINGVTEKKSLEVKERPKSKSKRVTEVPQGTMSPGEFKKWRKEVGFKKQLWF